MFRKSWLLLLPLITGLLVATSVVPSHAAGELFRIIGPTATGCATGQYTMLVEKSGFDGSPYVVRTLATGGGKVYMNEETAPSGNGQTSWSLFDLDSYSVTPPALKGTWPIPQNLQLQVRITLERPKGTILSSWTMVLSSCNSLTTRYNGLTSDDVDNDLVPIPQDKCPNLKASTANGCPVRSRSISLGAFTGPKRVAGKLSAPGYLALAAGRTVNVYKVRSGPDLKVKTLTTSSTGRFAVQVSSGRYYATSPGVIVPSAGQVSADRSVTVTVP